MVIFLEYRFNNVLSPEILEFLSEYQKVKFGSCFNKPVDNLPNSLTHLEFGDFNQPVDNLPNSLTHLEFGDDFNQPVDNLPNSIVHLEFGWNFNQQLIIYQTL